MNVIVNYTRCGGREGASIVTGPSYNVPVITNVSINIK